MPLLPNLQRQGRNEKGGKNELSNPKENPPAQEKCLLISRTDTPLSPTWFNLTRYHGVFAPGHAWRDFIVQGPKKKRMGRSELDPPKPKESKPSSCRAVGEFWIPWADLMRKTFGTDPEICTCGGKFIVQDCVTDAEGIAAMMAKMGLSATPPPLGKAKANDGEKSYVFED